MIITRNIGQNTRNSLYQPGLSEVLLKQDLNPVNHRYKVGKKAKQTVCYTLAKVNFPICPQRRHLMEKTKSKTGKFLKLDRLGQRIAHATRSIAKRRKERAERSYERRMLQLT